MAPLYTRSMKASGSIRIMCYTSLAIMGQQVCEGLVLGCCVFGDLSLCPRVSVTVVMTTDGGIDWKDYIRN